MKTITHFILIDDDPLHLFIEEKVISKMIPDACIASFKNAREGLQYIIENYNPERITPTLLLLDLEMPGMGGDEFIEAFMRTDETIQQQIELIIVSSSIHVKKIQTVCSYACVSRFISKPFTSEELNLIMSRKLPA